MHGGKFAALVQKNHVISFIRWNCFSHRTFIAIAIGDTGGMGGAGSESSGLECTLGGVIGGAFRIRSVA